MKIAHQTQTNPESADEPEFYMPPLWFEPAISYNMENQNSELREDADLKQSTSLPEIESEPTRQRMFDDDAIDALVASAVRYAEEIASNNDPNLDAQLHAIFYQLRSHPRELLEVEFEPFNDEEHEEEASLQQEGTPKMSGWARGGAVSKKSNNDWETLETRNEDDVWSEKSGDNRSDFWESSRNGKYENDDVDRVQGKAANNNNEAVEDLGDAEAEENVGVNGFVGNFWDFVRRFAMDSLSVTSNFWYSVVGSGEEEAREKQGETEVEKMGEAERGDEGSHLEPNERASEAQGVEMSKKGRGDGSKKSQLKLLIAKVRKAVRESDRRGFRARRRKEMKIQNHKFV